ncbi:IRE (iron responsive element) [Haloferula helveola]|uniref:IRE (Iron responsive element) n=1 Tax=Haloferula helveola TaxID=490095 RepID=A0ABN6H394_9BACT|nr:IRE (iron responsive element) [Haloferula helveola]
MTAHRRLTLAAAGLLLVAGVIRAPIEQRLTDDLREKELLQKPVDIELSKKVGQGFWAVSLGGLRTLVATILNLRAFSFFEEHRWNELADTYGTVVQLAPHSPYYWDTGFWHMSYNASGYIKRNEEDLPEIRARAESERWVRNGINFLEEGIRQNPENSFLWYRLGWIYRDVNKPETRDYTKAADAFHKAVEIGDVLPYIRRAEAYAMARSDKYIDQALPLVRKLQQEPGGSVPTMLSLRFALEMREDPDRDPEPLAMELFGSEKHAYRLLGQYYLDIRENYPMNGIASYLRKLERKLAIAEKDSVFTAREFLEQQ